MVNAGAAVLLIGGCGVPPGAAVIEGMSVLPVAGVVVAPVGVGVVASAAGVADRLLVTATVAAGAAVVAGVLVPLSSLLLVAGADVEAGGATGGEFGAAVPVSGDVPAGLTVTAGGARVSEGMFG